MDNFGEFMVFPIFGLGEKSTKKISPMEKHTMGMDGRDV
jgi:hypothetical protein